MIRCNFCLSVFRDESELQLLRDGDEWYRGCPDCRTDEYLMDIADPEDSE